MCSFTSTERRKSQQKYLFTLVTFVCDFHFPLLKNEVLNYKCSEGKKICSMTITVYSKPHHLMVVNA